MIQSSFFVKNENLLKLQDAVKNSGCRFVNFKASDLIREQFVVVEGDSDQIRLFDQIYDRLTTNIRESVRKPTFAQKVRRFFNI